MPGFFVASKFGAESGAEEESAVAAGSRFGDDVPNVLGDDVDGDEVEGVLGVGAALGAADLDNPIGL